MNCPKCGASLPDDSLFCPYCGAKIGTSISKHGASHRASAVPANVLHTEEGGRGSCTDGRGKVCASGYFSRGGSLGEEPADSAPVQPAQRANNPQGQTHIDADSDMRCPHCGAAVGAENTFCSACGHRLKVGRVGSPKKKKRILTGIAASAAGIALIAGIVLLGNAKRSASESKETDSYSVSTEAEPDDAQSSLVGRTFERDLLLQDWIDRELSSSVGQITPEEVHSIYEAFFCENFLATDLVCLADVTHDGLDEMIVVHFCDDQNIEIDGYVYTIDEAKQVNLIYSRVGSMFHVRGFFNWYIGETAAGFVLASEEGYWSTGHGELSFHEYYLAQDGTVCDISSVSVASSDYATDEEINAAFDHYTELKSEIKANLYTIYVCPPNGYDTDTIAMYPMDPTDLFSIETQDEEKIIGQWTYHHELYGAVGIFAFEPDGTGYISVFDNVQYEYTYYVIGNTAFLTIDGDTCVCTFERNGDEMYWQMSGQTYYLTYRE